MFPFYPFLFPKNIRKPLVLLVYLCCSFKIYEQNLSRTLFRQSRFQIGSYSDIYQQNVRKTTLKKSIFKVGDSESISKILEKHLQRNLHFRKLFCIYEKNLWNTPVKEFFFSVYYAPGYICDCLQCTTLKCLTSVSVNHLETLWLFKIIYFLYIYIHIHIHTHIYMYIYIYIHTYTYIKR